MSTVGVNDSSPQKAGSRPKLTAAKRCSTVIGWSRWTLVTVVMTEQSESSNLRQMTSRILMGLPCTIYAKIRSVCFRDVSQFVEKNVLCSLWILCLEQGRNHGWKVEGDQGLGPNNGALAPCIRPKTGLGVGCRRGSPPPVVRVRGSQIFFWKLRSCIPAFWWLLAVKFLAFWKLRPTSCGDLYVVGASNLKVGGPVSPGPYSCCGYDMDWPATDPAYKVHSV